MTHTPPPWQVIPDYSQENVYRLWDLDGNFHDDTSPETMDANAQFIVRACNAHEELAAALQETMRVLRHLRDNRPSEYDALVGGSIDYLNMWDRNIQALTALEKWACS